MKRYLRRLLGVRSPSGDLALGPREHRALAEAAEKAGIEPLPEEWPALVWPPGAPMAAEQVEVAFKEPPSGWYSFGTHAGWDSGTIPQMDFSEEEDDGGLPLWEKPRGWVPAVEPVGPMTGEQVADVTQTIRDVMKKHLSEHRAENTHVAIPEVKWACNMECIARAVVLWLEQEAERQDGERDKQAVEEVPRYASE